jgi:hypothetical protein
MLDSRTCIVQHPLHTTAPATLPPPPPSTSLCPYGLINLRESTVSLEAHQVSNKKQSILNGIKILGIIWGKYGRRSATWGIVPGPLLNLYHLVPNAHNRRYSVFANFSYSGAHSRQITAHSVAKGPKFRPQNSKGALKKFVRPEKLAAEFSLNMLKKGRKGAELFWRWIFI